MAIYLHQIIHALGGHLHGDDDIQITGLASLKLASSSRISFVSNVKYEQDLADSKAGCVIVSPQLELAAKSRGACIVTDQPYVYFARLTQLWKQEHSPQNHGSIHPSAVVDAYCGS